jgi:hypothetical protein
VTEVIASPVTPQVTRTKGGMRKWMFMEPYRSKIDGKPFLDRFVFFFTPWAGCHLTWIRQPDNQREWPHDHSATFLSVRLAGGYSEDVFTDPIDLTAREHRVHRWLSATRLRASEAHSITKISRWGTVTLLFLGKRRQASNYWTPDGKVSLRMTMDELPM